MPKQTVRAHCTFTSVLETLQAKYIRIDDKKAMLKALFEASFVGMQLRIINGSPVCYHYHFLKRAKFLTYLSIVSEVILTGKANTSSN